LRESVLSFGQTVGLTLLGLAALFVVVNLLLWLRYHVGCLFDRRQWRRLLRTAPTASDGEVQRLTITPLVEWRSARERWRGDVGLSYLIDADGRRVLFDLGDFRARERPSTLAHNLGALGHDPAAFSGSLTALVLSHAHREHVGGFWAAWRKRPGTELDLSLVPRFAPWDGAREPRPVADGVWVSPPLPGRSFVLGRVREHVLMIRLAGKGVVCVVGDAHPDPILLLEYAERATGLKPFAYVGGLYALLPRELPWMRRWLVSRRPPWQPSEPEQIGMLAVGLREAGV
jgi:metal-dependent hydrolase (beta-lactamase superfamily II)